MATNVGKKEDLSMWIIYFFVQCKGYFDSSTTQILNSKLKHILLNYEFKATQCMPLLFQPIRYECISCLFPHLDRQCILFIHFLCTFSLLLLLLLKNYLLHDLIITEWHYKLNYLEKIVCYLYLQAK